MNKARVLIAGDVALWLRTRRNNVRLTISEAAERSQIPADFISQWEDGMPIPISDFFVLTKIYQVPGVVVGAYVQRLYKKFLGE